MFVKQKTKFTNKLKTLLTKQQTNNIINILIELFPKFLYNFDKKQINLSNFDFLKEIKL